jgi:hypothetical protein
MVDRDHDSPFRIEDAARPDRLHREVPREASEINTKPGSILKGLLLKAQRRLINHAQDFAGPVEGRLTGTITRPNHDTRMTRTIQAGLLSLLANRLPLA